jgi:L-fuculose-phosphate aldolase
VDPAAPDPATEPATTEPAATEPATTEPATTEPTTTEPTRTELAAAGLTATDLTAARAELHRFLLRMVDDRRVVGSAGNASVRLDEHTIVVSAGGRLYDELTPDDHPVIDLRTGQQLTGQQLTGPQFPAPHGLRPTSELALHLAVMRSMPDVQAVVHTHSPWAAGWSVARLDLDFVCNENIGPAGERILVTEPYAPPGSTDLADAAVATLRRQPGSRACLLANHGPLTIGASLGQAYLVAQQVEWIAQVSAVARSLGHVHVIPPDHQDAIGATYGFTVARPQDRS